MLHTSNSFNFILTQPTFLYQKVVECFDSNNSNKVTCTTNAYNFNSNQDSLFIKIQKTSCNVFIMKTCTINFELEISVFTIQILL